MDYKSLPVFKGITPEMEAYLDRFDEELRKNNLQLSEEDILIRKIDMFTTYVDSKGKKNFDERIEKQLKHNASEHGNPSLLLTRSLYDIRRNAKNTPPMPQNEYNKIINL